MSAASKQSQSIKISPSAKRWREIVAAVAADKREERKVKRFGIASPCGETAAPII